MKKLFVIALAAILLISSIGCSVSDVIETTSESPQTDSYVCPSGTHTDVDSDAFCDTCSISVTVTVDFYAINDLHGKLLDGNDQPGVDELTSYLKSARDENPNTVFLSSGDMWQGASESNLTHGRMMTDWMNSLSFTSMTIGNHEFDWGEEFIEANAELADFPFLAINIYDRACL